MKQPKRARAPAQRSTALDAGNIEGGQSTQHAAGGLMSTHSISANAPHVNTQNTPEDLKPLIRQAARLVHHYQTLADKHTAILVALQRLQWKRCYAEAAKLPPCPPDYPPKRQTWRPWTDHALGSDQ